MTGRVVVRNPATDGACRPTVGQCRPTDERSSWFADGRVRARAFEAGSKSSTLVLSTLRWFAFCPDRPTNVARSTTFPPGQGSALAQRLRGHSPDPVTFQDPSQPQSPNRASLRTSRECSLGRGDREICHTALIRWRDFPPRQIIGACDGDRPVLRHRPIRRHG